MGCPLGPAAHNHQEHSQSGEAGEQGDEQVAVGDALMAALAVGHPGFEDYGSLTRFVHDGITYVPDMERHEIYRKYQQIYDALYGATADLAHKLSE